MLGFGFRHLEKPLLFVQVEDDDNNNNNNNDNSDDDNDNLNDHNDNKAAFTEAVENQNRICWSIFMQSTVKNCKLTLLE